MEKFNLITNQRQYAAKTSFENLMRRALNYNEESYDSKKYKAVNAYNLLLNHVEFSFHKINHEIEFGKLMSYLKSALKKSKSRMFLSRQKIKLNYSYR